MKALKRKTRSDKFPLTFHPTGQYCKKIKRKMYYFGSDKKQALEKYLDQATYLHGCQNNLQQQKPTGDIEPFQCHTLGQVVKFRQ